MFTRRDFLKVSGGAAAGAGMASDLVTEPALNSALGRLLFSPNYPAAEELRARDGQEHLAALANGFPAAQMRVHFGTDGYEFREVSAAGVDIFRRWLDQVLRFERIPMLSISLDDYDIACAYPVNLKDGFNSPGEQMMVEAKQSGEIEAFQLSNQSNYRIDGTGPAITTMVDMRRLATGVDLTRKEAKEIIDLVFELTGERIGAWDTHKGCRLVSLSKEAHREWTRCSKVCNWMVA